MKHNSNLLSERIVLGLFSLLFILSAAQVAAILNMQDYKIPQKAQVTLTSTCLQVTHRGNIDTLQFFDESEFTPANQYWYKQYFDIKNICSYPVHVINPVSLNNTNYPNPLPFTSYVKLQTYNNLLVPQDLPPSGAITDQNIVFESLACVNCEPGVETYHTSPASGVPSGNISGYLLNPNQTRNFVITVLLGVPDNSPLAYRIVTDKLKYFNQSAIPGGIALKEIKTHDFSLTAQNNYATDYVNSSHSPNFEPMMLQGGSATISTNQKGPGVPGLSDIEATMKSLSQ